jgi:hypothetical protein
MDIMHDVIKREISAGKRPMALAAYVIYLSAMNTAENTVPDIVFYLVLHAALFRSAEF